METQSAFVRPDRTVHLNAKAAIDVEFSGLVTPRHPEHDDALRLDDSLDDFLGAEFGVPVEHDRERFDDFVDRLVKFSFGRVLCLHLGHQRCRIISHGRRQGFRMQDEMGTKIFVACSRLLAQAVEFDQRQSDRTVFARSNRGISGRRQGNGDRRFMTVRWREAGAR